MNNKCKHGVRHSGHNDCSKCLEVFLINLQQEELRKKFPEVATKSKKRKDFKGSCEAIGYIVNQKITKKEMIDRIRDILIKVDIQEN